MGRKRPYAKDWEVTLRPGIRRKKTGAQANNFTAKTTVVRHFHMGKDQTLRREKGKRSKPGECLFQTHLRG